MGKSGGSSSWPDLHKVCWLFPCKLRSFVWTCPRNPVVFLPLFCIPCKSAHDRRRITACGLYSAKIARISGNFQHMQVVFPNFSAFLPRLVHIFRGYHLFLSSCLIGKTFIFNGTSFIFDVWPHEVSYDLHSET